MAARSFAAEGFATGEDAGELGDNERTCEDGVLNPRFDAGVVAQADADTNETLQSPASK